MRRQATVALALATLVAAMGGPSLPAWTGCAAQPNTEIFSGITYGCAVLEPTREGWGIIHWVRIDLSAPGIELYVTPLDSSAVRQGWQYRLRWIDEVVQKERLAVAINGTMFNSPRQWRARLAGDLATTAEMVVADHVPAFGQFWKADYLLWFDAGLTPSVVEARPPPQSVIERAKWAISGGTYGLRKGEVWREAERQPNARTAVAIDHDRKLLFFAVADWISPHRLFGELARLGAKDAILLDGGSSSAMAIGQGARAIFPGALIGGLRPVATYFGVRVRIRPLGRTRSDGTVRSDGGGRILAPY